MLKKINDFLSGLPMTIVAGVFLLLDLVPHLMEEFGGTPVRLSFLPVDKEMGEEVFCGTINRFGSIDISATKVGENSSLQKLIRMVQDAENKQAPMQRIADRAASWLVPVALFIAILAYVFSGNIVTAVTVLVVFCPCALVLATPTAIMAAIGQATKHGVIIKSGEALEKMGKVDTIAFDKTGTLTYGRLDVSDIISFDEKISETELLALAASAEARSEHPLGKAIVAYAATKGVMLTESGDFKMTAGNVSALSRCPTYCARKQRTWFPALRIWTPVRSCSPATIRKRRTILQNRWESPGCVQSCCRKKRCRISRSCRKKTIRSA